MFRSVIFTRHHFSKVTALNHVASKLRLTSALSRMDDFSPYRWQFRALHSESADEDVRNPLKIVNIDQTIDEQVRTSTVIENGEGVINTPDGYISGTFVRGKIHGPNGKTYIKDKFIKEGEFRDGSLWNGTLERLHCATAKFNKKLVCVYVNGKLARGTHVKKINKNLLVCDEGTYNEESRLCGWGKRTFLDGAFCEGEFDNGVFIKGAIHLSSGKIMEGSFINGKLHGPGKCTRVSLKNPLLDISEEGEYENGALHGKGTRRLGNGTFQQGEFRKGIFFDGSSKLVFSAGYFEGVLVKGKQNGKQTFLDGSFCEGIFENNKLVEGTWYCSSGILKEGKFLDGKLHGPGRCTHTSSENPLLEDISEEGEYENGALHGKGTRKLGNGTFLQGEFRDGIFFDGSGKLVHEDGFDEGTWVDGAFHEGTCSLNNGSFLQGEFREGILCNGTGKLVHEDGYDEGTWVDGAFHEGTCSLYNGSFLQGEFREGMLYNGSGKLVHEDGYDEGTWVDGAFQEGTRKLNNGSFMQGEFRDGLLYIGTGMLVLKDGGIEKGTWVNGALHEGSRRLGNGTILKGEFRDGLLYNGTGKVFRQEGFDEGTWVDGAFQGGTRSFYNGSFLQGEFREGMLYNGSGKLVHMDGDIVEGTWVDGLFSRKQ